MHLLFTVTATHIARVRSISYKTARKELQAVRAALALDKSQPLKLRDLAAYWDFCPKELAGIMYDVKMK